MLVLRAPGKEHLFLSKLCVLVLQVPCKHAAFVHWCFGFAGTRQAAFVHAISSAGVSHAVTRACSSGQLDRCGCDRTIRGKSPKGFEWAGCSDNIGYGSAFCKAFVDARERARGAHSRRALMNLHNNEAGRKVRYIPFIYFIK